MINKELDKLYEKLFRFGCAVFISFATAALIAMGFIFVQLIKNL